jgi:GGDEF domain-containing protein
VLVPDHAITRPLLVKRLATLCETPAGVPAWRISYGTAAWRPGDEDIDAAIRRADGNLYIAKRARPLARAA